MRDRETVMSTPVESDKRDMGRVGRHNESSSMEVACGRVMEGEGWGGVGWVQNSTIPEENKESNRGGLDHREWSV